MSAPYPASQSQGSRLLRHPRDEQRRTSTVNPGQLAGPKVAARWYDPANGTHSAVAGSPFLASGSQSFRPAGNNASNYGDWALMLESSQ